jgi:hypothetical protein
MPDRSKDRAKMLSPEQAEARAIEENTARLRALRLARDAAEQATGTAKAGARVAAGKKSRKPADKAASLSEWLAAQQKEGRRS